MTLDDKLTSAEMALHRLATGSMFEVVEEAGRGRVQYAKADMNKLESYIADLKAQIAGNSTRGAIGIVF